MVGGWRSSSDVGGTLTTKPVQAEGETDEQYDLRVKQWIGKNTRTMIEDENAKRMKEKHLEDFMKEHRDHIESINTVAAWLLMPGVNRNPADKHKPSVTPPPPRVLPPPSTTPLHHDDLY